MALQNIRSNTASKRPLASGLSDGQIAVNTNETSPGLFFKGASGAVLKVGPVHVGNSAPNSLPATGGSTGNSVGEQWLDTSNTKFVFKIWDGTAWRSETGEFVDVTGDTMTGNLTISGADLVMQNGEIIAASGTAAAPSITFDGDLNTGFYKPAADKLGISTGGTSRVIIDDSGNVGINTTDPDYKLQVSDNNNTSISIKATADDTSARATRLIYSFDDGDGASINASRATSDTAADVNLSFRTGGITNSEERMRIKSDGNVGIGTTDPGAKLDIKGTSGTYPTQIIQHSALDVEGEFLRTSRTDSGVRYHSIVARQSATTTTGNNYIQFKIHNPDGGQTAQNTALHLDGTGNVGIGTTSPVEKLSVSNQGENGIELKPDFNTNNSLITSYNRDASVYTGLTLSANAHIFSKGGAERARIDSSGRLLVGTSIPRTNFYNGNNTAQIQLEGTNFQNAAFAITCNANSPDKGGLIFAKSRGTTVGSNTVVQAGDDLGAIEFQGADGSQFVSGANIKAEVDGTPGADDMPGRLVFSTTADGGSSPAERMRIDSGGNVGIGTSAPDELLHIEGDVAEFKGTNTNSIDVSAGTEQVFKFGIEGQKNVVYGPAGSIIFRQDGTWSAVEPNFKPTRIELCTQDDTATDKSEIARLVVDQDGKVGIGTTSPQVIFAVASPNTNTTETIAEFGNQTIANGLQIETNGNLDWGFNARNSRNLTFSTNQNEAARIDSSGRLLVGTSSSLGGIGSSFQISGNSSSAGMQITRFGSSDGCVIDLSANRSSTINTYSVSQANDELSRIRFIAYDGVSQKAAAQITAALDGTVGANDVPGRLVFATTGDGASSPTERMRITQSGDVLIRQTTTNTPGAVNTTLGLCLNSNGTIFASRFDSPSAQFNVNADASVVALRRSGVQVGSISVTTTATAYNTSSDYRLKENVVPLANAADRVNQLQVHRFNFIADPDTTVDGFLAHEAQAVVPECVTGTKDEVDDEGNPVYQGIDQSKIVPLLTAALQEALAKIETLEQRLTDAGL